MSPESRLTNLFRLFFALDYTGVGIIGPYLALYLTSAGLSGGEIGVVLGTIPLVGFLVQPLWGLVSDIYHLRRRALVIGALGVSLTALMLSLTTNFYLLVAIALVMAVMKAPINPIGTALALEHLERSGNQHRFGSLRLWGSIGFAFSSFVIGSLFIEDAVWLILPLYSLTMFALSLTAMTLPDAQIDEQVNWRDGLTLLKRDRNLAKLLLGVLLIGATLGIVNNYLAVYLVDIQAPGWVIGAALAISALCEVPLMAQAPAFIKRWGLRLVLVGGVGVFPLRWLLYAIITEPLLVLPTQVLHSIAMMSLLVVGVVYVDRQLRRSWRATGQALYAASLHGVGPSLGLFLAGQIYERAGITPVWLISAFIATAGILIVDWAIRAPAIGKTRPEVIS